MVVVAMNESRYEEWQDPSSQLLNQLNIAPFLK
jgi:hypothetical protein